MDLLDLPGARRCREPAETLELIRPLLGDAGITRLADITGLDTLGIPVVQAVRPLAATVSVSQGKGATLDAAKVSAAMEALELHHAESAVPPPAWRGPAAGLDLGYDLAALDLGPGSLVTEHAVLDWIEARGMITGARTLVPRDLVWLGKRTWADWRIAMMEATSNGLAGGNTIAEAAAHALYEAAERDAGATLAAVPPPRRRYLDLDTVPDGWCAHLVARIRAAGAWLEVTRAPSRFGLAAFAAYLWAEDHGAALAAGAAAHPDPAVALSRAIAEAAQSRLAFIAGSRDDLGTHLYPPAGQPGRRPCPEGPAEAWADLCGAPAWSCRTDEEEARAAARCIAAVAGAEPVTVTLATGPGVGIVKVVCPGLAFGREHIPRRQQAAA